MSMNWWGVLEIINMGDHWTRASRRIAEGQQRTREEMMLGKEQAGVFDQRVRFVKIRFNS